MNKKRFKILRRITAAFVLSLIICAAANAANSGKDADESAREDRLTGGAVRRAALEPGNADVRITVDVPSFIMTLWQGGKEIAVYRVGVGMKDFPIAIGERTAAQMILNPDWNVPDSEWVAERGNVQVGERITARDPRNPLGKIKIPLGSGYLLHEAKGAADLGSLVSHGCVRVLRRDLIDLTKKIARAQDLNVTDAQIDRALLGQNQKIIELAEPLQVDVNYDTMVVENGKLHIYPDVYDAGVNTIEILKTELQSNNVDANAVTDATLKKMLARAVGKQQFIVALADIKANLALTKGKIAPVVGSAAAPKTKR